MEPKPKPQTAARLIADHMKWYGRLAEVSVLIARRIVDKPTDDPELAELIQRWKAINQENEGSDRTND